MLGFVSKVSVWMPHELREKRLIHRISICPLNLTRHKREPFLDHLVTGDEKWMVCIHGARKKAYVFEGETPPSTSKAGVHQNKYGGYDTRLVIDRVRVRILSKSWMYLRKKKSDFHLKWIPVSMGKQRTSSGLCWDHSL
ncbi:hypothetical protein TNCV_357011 [Trichonephila clavipes]|nr:hypothetical protein TNCV_357011 [Trichonephila clavipes]